MALPTYLRASIPNPPGNRAPWHKNIAPAYAGIFLAVIFYLQLATPTLSQAGVGVCLAGLLVAGLLCFGLYYYAPAMLGMRTGRPLYVVATSTFGAQGNYLPGLLMGLLQLGFMGAITYFASDFIVRGLHSQSRLLFALVAVAWGYGLAWIAIAGIQHVARVARILNWIPLATLLIVFFAVRGGIDRYHPPAHHPGTAFLLILEIVIGYTATAAAAGADFGINARRRGDIFWGGLVGIALAILVAGGLEILAVAGAIGRGAPIPPGVASAYDFTTAISSVGALAGMVFFLFAAALCVPTAFTLFIAANSFSTMLPKVPRAASTLIGATIGLALAITGVASNLLGFFGIVGAAFGPVCGAMAADYVLAGKRWSGPRAGVNGAGYVAWAVGCAVGMLNHVAAVPASWKRFNHPAPLFSFVVAFAIYWVLAKAGFRSAILSEAVLKAAVDTGR